MSDFEQRMQAFRQRFIGEARAQAGEIDDHAANARWSAVRDLSHRLAGRAGMFGFSDVTDLARALEEAIDADVPAAELKALAGALTARLHALES